MPVLPRPLPAFALALLVACSSVDATALAALVTPEGVGPGTAYRLVYNTRSRTRAGSDDIEVYNSFAQASANAAGMGASEGAVWKAIASTATVDARENIAGSDDVPIYNLAGQLVASGDADLWDGTLSALLNYNEFGQLNNVDAWTGTLASGEKDPVYHLGSEAAASWCGRPSFSDGRWTAFITPFADSFLSIFAISEPIIAPFTADFDADAAVGGGDFLIWQRNRGAVGGALSDGDANGDATIDAADLMAWEMAWGANSAALSTSTAPEPTSSLMVAASACGAVMRRRRSTR
ncbi:MAG: PEP-CTERM sorting domain-containing protein [Planctomycetales bacterium]|nr:PEP-CTERM sorting domain-containing protein [Planctomycetales bacterium]